jgi:hypothetical protein
MAGKSVVWFRGLGLKQVQAEDISANPVASPPFFDGCATVCD